VTLIEFFPPEARRERCAVVRPDTWSTQGFALACENFLQSRPNALFSFTENDTIYAVHEYAAASDSPANPQATVALTPGAAMPLEIKAEEEIAPATSSVSDTTPVSNASIRQRNFSWRDVGPDALRGALQGALAGAAGGVLLGALAALFGDGDFLSGALRGLWALPIGALTGALLGALRALPSDAPPLATASARTREQHLLSTLSGAGKGALLGLALGLAFLLFANVSGLETPAFSLLRAALLFAISGAFAGGIVGFIRIAPRDRSRR
jgi:hypothetical protein